MHYYKKNIGDYHKKAGRLSILQHGAYNLLIDSCYDRESFPTIDEAIDWVWASSEAEVDAVKFVLKKFFHESDGVYIQSRIQDDLEKYQANSVTNKRIAIERERKRRETERDANSTKRADVVNDSIDLPDEATPNHKPLTINQEPLTNNQELIVKDTGTKAKRFMPPTLDQILFYCNERLNNVDANKFIDHYTSNGWLVGKNKMKDWKAAVRTWEKSNFDKPKANDKYQRDIQALQNWSPE